MARMQLEVEKQSKKKSPVADMVGIPTLGGGRRLRLHPGKLHEMNIAQLQVLVNDLHSQIEREYSHTQLSPHLIYLNSLSNPLIIVNVNIII